MTQRSQQYMASTALHKRREISLDLDVEPVPRGWERCLDLKTGVMYFKQMETGTTDGRKKFHPVKVSDRFKSCRVNAATTKLDLEADLKLSVNGGQQKHSMLTSLGSGLSKPVTQSLKRQRFLSNDEDDGLGLQLSLSLRSPCINSQSVKSPRKLQSEDKIPLYLQLDLCQKSSLHDRPSQIDSWSRMGQNPVPDTASSSLSRCSSSASSLSEAVEAGKQTGNCDTQEVESNKNKSDEVEQAAQTRRSISAADMMAGGCAKCLMFVLMFRNNPKCPKCGSSILVDLPAPNERFVRRRNL